MALPAQKIEERVKVTRRLEAVEYAAAFDHPRPECTDLLDFSALPHTAGEARYARENRVLGEQIRQLQQTVRRLKRLAYIDPLTGLANRRFFEAALDQQIRRASRAPTSIAVALCDVDHFKRFNDEYGHERGDEILRAVGRVLRAHCRRVGDVASRYGGEEFAILLPSMERLGGLMLVDRIRRAVTNVLALQDAGSLGQVTISIGITSWYSSFDTSAADTIRVADRALYDAKEGGRDRVHYLPVLPRSPFEGRRSRAGLND